MNIKHLLIIYYTILRKEATRVLRIWPQTILPSAITVTLYFLIVGKVIGSRIGNMEGFEYMQFITPGLIIMAVINSSYFNVVGSFYGSKFNKSIEELLISPANDHLIILGYISGGIVRGVLVAVVVNLVAFFFGGFELHIYSAFLVMISIFMCCALFSLGGFINGILSQKFDDTTIFPNFILVPLIYLGGIFYSLKILPPFWQKLAMYNPLFYIVDFVRYAYIGSSLVSPNIALTTIVILIFILYLVCWTLLSRGIRLKS